MFILIPAQSLITQKNAKLPHQFGLKTLLRVKRELWANSLRNMQYRLQSDQLVAWLNSKYFVMFLFYLTQSIYYCWKLFFVKLTAHEPRGVVVLHHKSSGRQKDSETYPSSCY